jgi:hypothetical protein
MSRILPGKSTLCQVNNREKRFQLTQNEEGAVVAIANFHELRGYKSTRAGLTFDFCTVYPPNDA